MMTKKGTKKGKKRHFGGGRGVVTLLFLIGIGLLCSSCGDEGSLKTFLPRYMHEDWQMQGEELYQTPGEGEGKEGKDAGSFDKLKERFKELKKNLSDNNSEKRLEAAKKIGDEFPSKSDDDDQVLVQVIELIDNRLREDDAEKVTLVLLKSINTIVNKLQKPTREVEGSIRALDRTIEYDIKNESDAVMAEAKKVRDAIAKVLD